MGNPTSGKRRNRREEMERRRAKTKAKHAAQSAWSTFMLAIGLVMLFGTAGGITYYFAFYDKPEINVTDYEKSFRVLGKDMLTGEIIEKEIERGAATKDFADWVEPRFYLICEADVTNARIIYQVPESTYNNTRTGDVFSREHTIHWTVVDRTTPTVIEVLERNTGLNLNAIKQ